METTAFKIDKYIPEYVDLHPTCYNDNLLQYKDTLNECVQKNSIQPIYDIELDIIGDPQTDYYLYEIRGKLEDEYGHIEGALKYIEKEDEIINLLYDKDESDAVSDLISNTPKLCFFYNTGIQIPCFDECEEGNRTEYADQICNCLGIDVNTEMYESVLEMINNSYYGGDLRIYFESSFEDVITNNDKNEFSTISFNGEFAVAIYDSLGGSGDFDYFNLNKTFSFCLQNISCNEINGYNIESSFGLCKNWLNSCAKVEIL